MKKTALLSLTLCSVALAVSKPVPGSVQGQVLDTRGKPVEGVKVWIKPVVTTGVAETLTDENGRYKVTGLPPVGYSALAWLEVPFKGKTFCYRLAHPKTADYNAFNPRDGIVRNFQWKLTGRIPLNDNYSDHGFFGGSISPMQGGFQDRWATNNDEIELQLTPVGNLIDGSVGKPLTVTAPGRGLALDIPIGSYRVKATFVSASGKREALNVAAGQDGEYARETTINFAPTGPCTVTGGAPGRAYVYWRFQ